MQYAPMAHLKKMLNQKHRVKSEDLFFGETPISGKFPTFSENSKPFSCEKILYPPGPHLAL